MPGRMIWDEATGQLVPEPEEDAGGDASRFAPMVWDEASGGLVAEADRDKGQTAQPHAAEEKQSLWDEFMSLATRTGGAIRRELETEASEDVAASQGAWLHYLDDMMPSHREQLEQAAARHPDYAGAGTAATAGLASALAPASIPAQAAVGALVGGAAARGRGAGWSETAGDAAIGAVGGGIGQLYGNVLGRAFGPTRSTTPKAPQPAARPLTETDDWLINMHTPTDEEVARAGWPERPVAPLKSQRPPRTTGAASDLPAGFARAEEVVPEEVGDALLGPFEPPAIGPEDADRLSRGALLRSDRPRATVGEYAPRDPFPDDALVRRGEEALGDIPEGPAGLPRDRQTRGTAPMPYAEFASNARAYRPPGTGGVHVPPRPPLPPLDLPTPDVIDMELVGASSRRMPSTGPSAVDPDSLETMLTTRESIVPSSAPPARPNPDLLESLAAWQPPGMAERALGGLRRAAPSYDVPGLGRAGVNAAAVYAEQATDPRLPSAERVAYADTPVLSYALQSTLASGDTGLPPDAQSELTQAVASGDLGRVTALDYQLKQRHPAYARRIERVLRQLNEED